ncbi:pheromone processing endoprotease [Coemansia javaensis]|uniref:Pheromone processing endoprotease n=1 Tax=Coemansia javaensis TaxID=2761396 RepID=A0A9W8H5Y2_9FUNG|nr:pheromone processing endoprotease [Coemansia javaensis]
MRIQVAGVAALALQLQLAAGSPQTAAWARLAAHEPAAVPAAQADPRYEYVAVKFAGSSEGAHIDERAERYAGLTGWEGVGRLGSLPRYRVFRRRRGARLARRGAAGGGLDLDPDPAAAAAAAAAVLAETVEPLRSGRRLAKRGVVPAPPGFGDRPANASDTAWRDITDPLYGQQWHLVNTKELGHDINVTGVWHQGVTGAGVTVALIDDGLDYSSDDLLENFDYHGSYDFNDRTKLPTPRLEEDYHGTRCAGQIAAARNTVCGVGVAYGAKVAGIRMLSKEVSDQDEVAALNYAMDRNWIYSCSWGPNDDGATVQGPSQVIEDAFINGIQNGRGGLGSLFVFATGNGGGAGDNCNFDGYTNSIYTMSIGAVDHLDRHPYYSEQCSAQLAVTYSNGDNRGIVTTDLGLRRCTDKHGGTSAAAPLAAGIFALALSVRPDLTWRDVQHLAVRTAVPVDPADADWADVARGRRYNHKYGFGKMDAWRIVQAARAFEHVGRQTSIAAPADNATLPIPPLLAAGGPSEPVERSAEITRAQAAAAKIKGVEHVTVVVDMDHDYRGNVEIWLESPRGVRSQLAAVRHRDSSKQGLRGWKFMSVKHWDEDPVGVWKLQVRNAYQPHHAGTLRSWQLTVYGESTEPEPRHAVPVVSDRPEPPPQLGSGSGSGRVGRATAVMLAVAFFVAGAATAALAAVLVMRWRLRRLAATHWEPLQRMGRTEIGDDEVLFSAHALPGDTLRDDDDDDDDDVFDYADVTAGASSSSVVKHARTRRASADADDGADRDGGSDGTAEARRLV